MTAPKSEVNLGQRWINEYESNTYDLASEVNPMFDGDAD
jgi:hypothetical protein